MKKIIYSSILLIFISFQCFAQGITGTTKSLKTGTNYTFRSTITTGTNYVWEVGPSLRIVSGQGTPTVVVTPSVTATECDVTYLNVYYNINSAGWAVNIENILINVTQDLSAISGPSQLNIPSGDIVATGVYSVTPIFPSRAGSYTWTIQPTSNETPENRVRIFPNRNKVTVDAFEPNIHTLTCTVSSPCVTGIVTRSIRITVRQGRSLSLANNGGNNFSFIYNDNTFTPADYQTSTLATYTLVNALTGAIAAKGKVDYKGGSLDFNNIPRGVYILKLDIDAYTMENQKIVIK